MIVLINRLRAPVLFTVSLRCLICCKHIHLTMILQTGKLKSGAASLNQTLKEKVRSVIPNPGHSIVENMCNLSVALHMMHCGLMFIGLSHGHCIVVLGKTCGHFTLTEALFTHEWVLVNFQPVME